MRANAGPLPRHRSSAEVRHFHDEEARGSGRPCSVGRGIFSPHYLSRDVLRFGWRIAKNVEQVNLAVPYCYCHIGLYFPAVRDSADLPRRSQNRETKRRVGCPAKLQPQTAARNGVQGAGNCVSEDDRNCRDGVPRLLLI